jgi:hypothetical protein
MLKPSVKRYSATLANEFASNPVVVFLCGPSRNRLPESGAALRIRLEEALSSAGFEVVLGEDDGLLDLQKRYGNYAHQNELQFVKDQAAAVVLVASSVGSFCELGMFADRLVSDDANRRCDVILIASEAYEKDPSYFNHGPARAVGDFGIVHYADFAGFDVALVVDRLRRRRTVFKSSKRGRPRKPRGTR